MEKSHELGWAGYMFASKEHCTVGFTEHEILINGIIRSRPSDIDLRLSYGIVLNHSWETERVRIGGSFDGRPVDYDFTRNGALWTNWDGMQLSGGLEPDISLTPLTNTLPIRRLRLIEGQSAEIDVLYFDLTERTVDIRRQRYTCIDRQHYRFETVPKDFEALIEVDDEGFVMQYPELFSRI